MQNLCVMNAPQPVTTITVLQFRSRFSTAEKSAIYTAAAGNAGLRAWLDDLAVAEFVDIADPRTVGAVSILVAAGLVTADRAAEILS